MNKLDRRKFLKVSGAAAAAIGTAGVGAFGYAAGKDPMTYTGTESMQGAAQTFNREGFAVNIPTYEKVGTSSRVDARVEVIFYRMGRLRQYDPEIGLDSLDDITKKYYEKNPHYLEQDLYLRNEVFPKMREDNKKYGHQFKLAEAWSHAMGSVWPEIVSEAPEISDFPKPDRQGNVQEPVKLKSPEKTAELIKKIAHNLGSTLVGITKLNPDWVYKHTKTGRGIDPDETFEVPKHWEYAIVVGTPMEWDPFYANPNYGTSHDAYAKSSIIAYRLAHFINELGYAARPHTPGTDYDLMVPPICVDAGIGEQGRHSVIVTPELGSNFRPAIITTNIPMATDKPINFGVQKFCESCKICADQCPSGAISKEGKAEIRGYKRYPLDISKCYTFWYSNLGNIGCRLCLASCPYSRKSNWIHETALEVTANDPTSLSHDVLTAMQEKFYPAPESQDYYIPSLGGKNASYREAPWWLKSEDFIDFGE